MSTVTRARDEPRDAQGGFEAMHHHAQAVAHQHDVDVLIEQARGVGVIAGQHHDGLLALVRPDFRDGDALGLGLDGHEALR